MRLAFWFSMHTQARNAACCSAALPTARVISGKAGLFAPSDLPTYSDMASSKGEAKYTPDGPEAQRIARTIPYYPFKGIERFYDIGGMCADPEAFALAVKIFADRYRDMKIDSIGGFDARGFILGPPVALALNIPFFMLRKKGKMPNVIDGAAYSKEYKGDDSAGQDALCVQRSAATSGQRVVLVDDLVATGGTLMAGVDLVKSLGAEVVECACMIELKALNGVGRLHKRHPDVPVWSLISEDILDVKGEETS